jgi:endonuclease-3 related protein
MRDLFPRDEQNLMKKVSIPPLESIYPILVKQFGHRGWWPGDTPFEVILGAILTQNTAWSNVEKALTNLKKAKVFSIKRLREIPESELASLIRPSGYFNQKAKKIKSIIAFLDANYGGSIARMKKAPLERLRTELLEVSGIGPETADSILLYALDKKVFVVDAYTRRIFARHYYFDPDPSYDEVQERFEREAPDDLDWYNDFHAQIVAVGNRYCKPKPQCEGCPLEPLPHRTE